MPTFPSYHGPPLPAALNPLNPRHYWMLADWVFFKPSRLKQYLYRADPELYFQSGLKALFRAFRLPAYRSLLLMMPPLVFLLSFAIATAIAWTALAIRWMSVDGVGVALGVMVGLTWGVARSVAGSVAVDVARFVAGVVALGVALGVAWSVALGVAWGVTLGVAAGVVLGVAWGVALGVALGVAWSVIGVVWGVGWGFGISRGIFYAFQIWPALRLALRSGPAARRLAGHPALRDELAVLPFPGLHGLLAEALAEDAALGLRATRTLLRNPFQRWAVARGWAGFLARTPDPLAPLYNLLPDPLLDEYPVEARSRRDERLWPPVRSLWLGELAGVFVGATRGYSRFSEQLAWAATWPLRGRPHPQIAPLARLLLALLDEEQVVKRGADPALVAAAIAAVRPLPHGEEVALSLATLARLGDVEDLKGIAAVRGEMDWMDRLPEPPLRPQVLEAMRGLWDVATEVARFQEATSPHHQAAAINRATGMLEELANFVAGIPLPERSLLLRAVRRWRSLVAEEAGRLGERALREIAPLRPSGTGRR